MKRIRLSEREADRITYAFVCPGCSHEHKITTHPGPHRLTGCLWRPTVSPSIKHGTCHSLIIEGEIRFLDNCTHQLKGQTVPLPEIQEH